ncbi:MAG: DUF3800 domain-containing protein [Candidatus Rokubacteria bacterium]|nr:DUF3800 domain-containing protein [Candidatus Rokubacteria bacterium]
MEKLYAYADETGQDTLGGFFLVAVVVVGSERDELLRWLAEVEKETGKGALPWHKSRHEPRSAYMDRLLGDPKLRGAVFYSVYPGTRAYRDLTLLTIAKALGERTGKRDYKVTVVIDGLRRGETRQVAVGLRRIRVPVRKVRGGREESNALLRLADAMAGFIRDAEEGVAEWRERLDRAKAGGTIRQI